MQELRGQGAFSCWQALRDARLDLEEEVPTCFADCLAWAKEQFASFFHVSFVFFVSVVVVGGRGGKWCVVCGVIVVVVVVLLLLLCWVCRSRD